VLSAIIHPNGEFWVGHLARASGKGLVKVPKNHKTPRGLAGLTSYAKRQIRQGCHLLEENFGADNLSFFTGTLPGKTDDDCRRAIAHWPDIMRQFIQSIKRDLDRVGLPPWIVGCTEIQPKRWEKYRQPWPHCHLVFPARADGRWLLHREAIKKRWRDACKNVLGGIDADYRYAPRVDPLDASKGEVSGYLAKYFGKGESGPAGDAIANGWQLPRNWMHCTHSLSRAVAIATCRLRPFAAARLIRLAQKSRSAFLYCVEILGEVNHHDGTQISFGWCGRLSGKMLEIFTRREMRGKPCLNLV